MKTALLGSLSLLTFGLGMGCSPQAAFKGVEGSKPTSFSQAQPDIPNGVPTSPPTSIPPTSTPPAGQIDAVNDGVFDLAMDGTLSLRTSELLANDVVSAGGTTASITAVDVVTVGTVKNENGIVSFSPPKGFSGDVKYRYTIGNSLGQSDTALVSVKVAKPAQGSMYAAYASELFAVDPASGTSLHISYFSDDSGPASEVYDIALAGDGKLYALRYGMIYEIDRASGRLTKISDNLGAQAGNAMTVLSDGRIVLAGYGIAIYDPITKVVTPLVSSTYNSSGDIQAMPDGFLYWTVVGSNGDDLIRINPTTKEVKRIGSTGKAGIYGLGNSGGILYGFTGNREMFEIDVNTASVSNVKGTAHMYYGASSAPVAW